jgi:hypothetical protein
MRVYTPARASARASARAGPWGVREPDLCAVAGPSTSSCSANHSLGCDAVKPFGGYYHQDMRARAPRSAPVLLPKYRALHAPKPQRLSISTPQGHQMLVLVLLSPRAIRARAGRGLVTTTSPSSTATPTINGALPRPSALPPNENWVLMTVIKLFHNITAVVTRDESDSTTSTTSNNVSFPRSCGFAGTSIVITESLAWTL